MASQAAALAVTDSLLERPLAAGHPDRLAAIGRLLGLDPPAIERARVLEIGCGAGGNLLPMAERNPAASFVGIDESRWHAATAQLAANELGLSNVEFPTIGIRDVSSQLGTFDYIFFRGDFARLPAKLQDKVLAVCHAQLNASGLAYLGYRALPGSIWRRVVGELTAIGVASEASADERVAHARRMLRLAIDALSTDASSYGRLLNHVAEAAAAAADRGLLHEYMKLEGDALLLADFVERAAQHQLHYLADAQWEIVSGADLSPAVTASLEEVAGDRAARQRRLDLLTDVELHQSIVARQAVESIRFIPERLQGTYLAGPLDHVATLEELQNAGPVQFTVRDSTVISRTEPVVKLALAAIASASPRSVAYDELVRQIGQLLAASGGPSTLAPEDRTVLAENLLDCVGQGWIDVHTDRDRFVTTISARPLASRWARVQSSAVDWATNLRHEAVDLDQISRHVLVYLDGQHDRGMLLNRLLDSISQGRLSIMKDGLPVVPTQAGDAILEQALDQSLTRIAAAQFLIA